jgi:hypothetical protein
VIGAALTTYPQCSIGRLRDIHTVLSIAPHASPPDFASFSQSQK